MAAIAVGGSGLFGQRAAAALAVVVAVTAVVAVAVVHRRWLRSPVTRAQRQAALAYFPPERVERGRRMSAALAVSSWTLLAIRLTALPLLVWLGTAVVDWVSHVGQPWYVRVGLATVVLAGACGVVEAAPMWWDARIRAKADTKVAIPAGLGTALGFIGSCVTRTALVLAIFWAMRLWPVWWWLVLTAGYVAVRFAARILIDPGIVQVAAFGGKPVTGDRLRQRLADAATGAGVRPGRIMVVEKAGMLNAMIGGIGGRKRIAVFGPGLADNPESDTARPATGVEDEAVVIVTHEVAHVRYGDMWVQILTGTARVVITLGVIALAGGWETLLDLTGAASLVDPHAVGLILAIATAARMVGTPVQASLVRAQERRADQYALRATATPNTAVAAYQRALREKGGDPNPGRLSVLLWPRPETHPPLAERLATALAAGAVPTKPPPTLASTSTVEAEHTPDRDAPQPV